MGSLPTIAQQVCASNTACALCGVCIGYACFMCSYIVVLTFFILGSVITAGFISGRRQVF